MKLALLAATVAALVACLSIQGHAQTQQDNQAVLQALAILGALSVLQQQSQPVVAQPPLPGLTPSPLPGLWYAPQSTAPRLIQCAPNGPWNNGGFYCQ